MDAGSEAEEGGKMRVRPGERREREGRREREKVVLQ